MQELEFSKLSDDDQARLQEIDYSAPVYHIGKQWAVTGCGIEEVRSDADHNPYYHIGAADLDMNVGEGGWPRHMASKVWVDTEDFNKAYEIAKQVHK